jgi:uncharacterized protein YydD (DUF2326 family)
LGWWRQEDHSFEANLGYIVRLSQKQKQNNLLPHTKKAKPTHQQGQCFLESLEKNMSLRTEDVP